MLKIVLWKWKSVDGYRSTFKSEHVNTVCNMVDRNYPDPHEFILFTDDSEGVDKRVKVLPLPKKFAKVPNPRRGSKNPTCYRRLFAFSEEAKEVIGERMVSLDLDILITGDLRPLWNRDEDFVIWGDTAKGTPYNGSMWLLRTGTRTKVYDTFDPIKSPSAGLKRKYIGSDQAWLAVCLGPNEPRWTKKDGVYSFRNEINIKTKNDGIRNKGELPSDARIVIFHGHMDPWMTEVQSKYPWIKDYWHD